MNLELLAQQYLPISPRHVSLLTTDGSGGNPAAVVAVSPAFDPTNRLFFLEWDDPMYAASFRLTHVSVPGSSVTAIALMLSSEGVVHCVVQSRAGNGPGKAGDGSAVTSYVFRRTENNEEDDDCEEDRTPVTYRKLPKAIEDDGRGWTTALRLYSGSNRFVSGGGGEGRVVVACGGQRGESNALKLLSMSGTRMSVQQTVELPMLSTFPVLQLREIDGDASSVLALCHHAILEVDTRMKQSDSIVRAWKWTPHDPLITFAVRDNAVVAGTEEGVLVVWDLRLLAVREKSSGAVDHSPPCGAPVTGLHMPHSMGILSCHADGSVLTWDKRSTTDGVFRFAPRPTDALPPVFLGTPGCVTLAAEEHLAVVADDSGTLSVFYVS
ncbi:hypothetical protein, conserved [Trypanosoma cruzi]|uniref:Guanine nucleotide-binding protein subunit beta-like protein n=1 Tax=Trypanosoma cruzi (strain CL Brener) TaxID=353153 RepID=Q4DYI2_TRYCC|nr:hypothetical protein, conserved [Trypanosoma cruzi]EAN97568.1 hypothetical protein, conserved [Trypanosoma cruzi]|eukprot:XP_819419.1 hypothetical protein [Trypanosoma cruzi strain CL Brener]